MTSKYSIVFFALALLNCKSAVVPMYVGTYTNGESQGIYKLDFNLKSGELSELTLAASTENPSYLAYGANKKTIYAVNENEDGLVTSLKVESDGRLTMLNSRSTRGAHPCHVAVNDAGNKAVVSNYSGGNAAIFNIEDDGSLNEAVEIIDHNKAVRPSHVHSAKFYSDDLYISDLGRNAVYQYKLENEAYKLIDSSIVALPENAGPRHFSLTKDGQFMYIINEYASSITVIKRVGSKFELIEHSSTLSDNYKGNNACADIHLSNDERFLYGSNRGENTIAVFSRDPSSGMINKVQNTPVHGDWPRNFSLDPSGRYLLVANQKSNNISVFSVDASDGKLMFIHDIKVPAPVCLLF